MLKNDAFTTVNKHNLIIKCYQVFLSKMSGLNVSFFSHFFNEFVAVHYGIGFSVKEADNAYNSATIQSRCPPFGKAFLDYTYAQHWVLESGW